jgi:hypothetical protein
MSNNTTDSLTAMVDALREATKQARLAYQFAPGSYTHVALDRCLAAAKMLDQYVELKKENEKSGPVVAEEATTGRKATPGSP